jgi:xanthosine utilization system XapX-like protein
MEKKEIIRLLKDWMIYAVTFLYKWLTTDAEILGYILAVLHVLISTTLMICTGLAHTVYPTWQFKLGCYICMVLVWLQHIFLNVCIFTVAELSLTKISPPSNIYLSRILGTLMGTSLSEAMTRLIMGETITVSCFTLELLSMLMIHIYSLYDIQL